MVKIKFKELNHILYLVLVKHIDKLGNYSLYYEIPKC